MNTFLVGPPSGRLAAWWLLAIALGGCSVAASPRGAAGGTVPRMGTPMPAAASATGIVHKGRLLCGHWVEAGGVKYDFDVVCDSSIVVYVRTSDPRFRPPEGIAIGDSLQGAMAVPKASLGIVDGVCGVSLPSGWIARPGAGLESADESCNDLRSEPIAFFDTRYAGPE